MKKPLAIACLCVVTAGMCWWATRNPSKPPREPSAPADVAKPPAPPEPTAEWNTYHGDSGLRGVAAASLPDQLDILWRFKAGAPVRQTPVALGKRIFFATARGELFAIDLSGQRLWSQELLTGEQKNGQPVREGIEAPVACFDGMVFTGTERGTVYAHEADSGRLKWQAQVEGAVYGSPNYLRTPNGGRLFVISRGTGELYCMDTDSGKVLWKSEGVERCDGSPSVSEKAAVFGSCAAALHVRSPETGLLLRNIPIDSDSQVAGGVAQEAGHAYSGSRSGKVLRADVGEGKILWANAENEAEAFATPAVSADTVVQSYDDGNVCAINRETGKQRWKFDTGGTPASPVIAGDKAVVSVDGDLVLLKLADGSKVWTQKVSDGITSPALLPGMVLVGSEDGTVVALGAKPPAEKKEGVQ